VIHHANPDFWVHSGRLPEDIRRLADKAFELLKENPRHPSVQLKKVGELWSARVSLNHRALAVEAADGFVWFWVGTHAEYEKLLG
jgi:hypothetical protein